MPLRQVHRTSSAFPLDVHTAKDTDISKKSQVAKKCFAEIVPHSFKTEELRTSTLLRSLLHKRFTTSYTDLFEIFHRAIFDGQEEAQEHLLEISVLVFSSKDKTMYEAGWLARGKGVDHKVSESKKNN